MCTVCCSKHTHAFFPVDLLSQSHYSRRLPEPEGSSVNFKAPPPTPWKTGASVHENTAGGCICAVPVPSSVQQGNKQGGDTLKTLASHGVHGCVCTHVYVCVCVCVIAALYVIAGRCTAIHIQELDHLCTINNTLLDAPFELILSVC